MTVQIHGHRGYPAKFPENSLAGFDYGVHHGLEVIETDVQRTADGQLVMIHDEQIARVTEGSGMVEDYTLAELQTFPLANGEPIPTLDAFIKVVAGHSTHLNLEFKTTQHRYVGIEQAVQQKIEQAGLAAQTMYCSFNPDSLKVMHEIAPNQELALLYSKDDLTPVRSTLAFVDALHTDRYFPDEAIPQRMWTIDDPLAMRRLIRLPHVTGLITDCFELASDMVKLESSD